MIEIIRDIERLEDIADAWADLAQNNTLPMLSHSWTVAAAEAFGHKCEMTIFALWDGPRLQAVAPLAIFRNGLSRHLRLLSQELCEPEALLFRDRDALRQLLAAVTAKGPALWLALVRSGGDEDLVLREMQAGSLTYFGNPYYGHAAVLPQTVDELEDGLSSSTRSTLQRKLRKARELGEISFTAEALDEQNWDAFFQELVRVESSGWKRRNKTSLTDLEDQRRFFEFYGDLMAPGRSLRGYRMLIGGQTAAIRLAVVAGGKLHELKIGFDESFSACSPGMLLTHETLKAAIREGLTAHEFLGVAEDWQKHWPLKVVTNATVRRYPFGVNGALNLGRDALARIGSEMQQRFIGPSLAN
ncbi:GNAT family N-acetyltransferase [Pseudorhizobium flavum]|uniref:GNAT family N-acetyltransferase n=1 Tax=Pseudorhizobium flavum TaxID=1335061 RepID=UPI002490EB50|nr:GNAT family N-acetyltransferase [Pseudorhizobium flavum]